MLDHATAARFIHSSNRLDGIALSEEQTRLVLTGEVTREVAESLPGEDGKRYELELVLDHRRALEEVIARAADPQPLTQETLCGLHKTLMGGLLLSAGEYRECKLRYKGLLIASDPDRLAERMAWLVNLANAGIEKSQNPGRFAWRLHHEFITLHPFIEGNGRMARLLLNLARLRRGLDLTIVLHEARDQYSRAIIEFQQQKIRRAHEKAAAAGGLFEPS